MVEGGGASPDVREHETGDPLASLAAAAVAQSSHENFPVALRLLPATARDSLLRVYTYARFVDDVGDDAPGDRLALLDLVEADVRRLDDSVPGEANLAPVAGLGPVVRDTGCGLDPLLALIEANRVDQKVTRYATFDDLLGYCALSAAPVGRLVLAIAGVHDEQAQRWSDEVCAALQVLEHCQDVGEDGRAGRIYLPTTDLAAHGAADADVLAITTSWPLRRTIATQVDRSRALLAAGPPLVARLSGWARIAVAGYIAGGLATADQLEGIVYDVLVAPTSPSKARTAALALRLALRRRRA